MIIQSFIVVYTVEGSALVEHLSRSRVRIEADGLSIMFYSVAPVRIAE